ncbi:HU family DNA-binding protein [uncultured Fusobacterium sp.]|uniref:HU family DNA-binding protein n=1 Tax=uncultured Fusobacterium sp. TaxID=159267 RepID=UPI0025EB0B7B|nr:HU family DNA-binding protein [uncultured Fusobacterium sp.]
MNSKEFLHYYRKLSILKNQEVNLNEAEEDIKMMIESIAEAIILDNELKIKNKGKFTLIDKKRKIVQNIYTREKIELPSKKVFKYIQPKNLSISEESK